MTYRRHVFVFVSTHHCLYILYMFTHLHITCCTSNAPRLDSSFARWPSISFTAACFMPSGLGRTKCRKLIPHWWTAWSLRIGHTMFGEHLVPTLDAHIAEIVTWHQNLSLAKQLFASRIRADAVCIALIKGIKIRLACSRVLVKGCELPRLLVIKHPRYQPFAKKQP